MLDTAPKSKNQYGGYILLSYNFKYFLINAQNYRYIAILTKVYFIVSQPMKQTPLLHSILGNLPPP